MNRYSENVMFGGTWETGSAEKAVSGSTSMLMEVIIARHVNNPEQKMLQGLAIVHDTSQPVAGLVC